MARKAGATLVVIDPYRNRTAQRADVHLMIRPGTDAALALAMMQVLIERDMIDRDFITPPHHFFLNSAFNEIDRLRERAGQVRVMIHPETARTKGIADGDPVRVFNNRGECNFLAQVTDNTQVGLLVAEGLHWPSLSPGGGANQLTSQRLTDMGETCAFHCNLVEVQPQGN